MANFKGQEPEKVMVGEQQQTGSDDPKIQEIMKKAKGYETVLINLIHGEKTRDEVIDMLKSGRGDAFIAVPEAAMSVNDMGVMTMKQGGIKVEPAVQIVASQYLINDLLELGVASQSFEAVPEEEMEALVEDCYQMYIERGIKDKSIDPIQLQLEAEEIMTDEQKAGGMAIGGAKVPGRPSPQAMQQQQIDSQVNSALSSHKADQAKRQALQKRDALTGRAVQQATEGGQ